MSLFNSNKKTIFSFVLFILLILFLISIGLSCENEPDSSDDDDDSTSDDDDDSTSDDDGDDDSDDDSDDDNDDDQEVGAFYVYRYNYEEDLYCPFPPEKIVIANPAACDNNSDEKSMIDVIPPGLAIGIYFFEGIPFLGNHNPSTQYGDYDCRVGFNATYYPSDSDADPIYYEEGYVELRENGSGYEVDFFIEFEDGSTQEGLWEIQPCGDPLPE